MSFGRHIPSIFTLIAAAFVAVGCATTTAPSGSPEIAAELRAAQRVHRDDRTAETRAQQLFVKGMTQAHVGNHQAALDLYTQALTAAPNTAAILSAAAESYAAIGDETSAIYNTRRARELAPENPYYHFQLAQLFLSSGDAKSAAGIYEEILRQSPDDLEALYELARVRTIGGDFAGAIATYEQLIAELGDDRDIHNEILQLYVRLGDQGGMERTLKRMISEQPEDVRLHRMLGEIYLDQNRPEEAARQLEEALESNPGDVETLLSLTDVYRATGRADSADALLERAARMDAATPDQLLAQAAPLYARSADDPDALSTAVQILNRVLEMDRENPEALVMLGDIRTTEGKYQEAADLLYRALEENPRDPHLWVQTAGAFLLAEDRSRAIEVADEGLLLFPGFLPLLRLSGFALLEVYRNADAIRRLEEAVSIVREDSSEGGTELAEMLGALALLYTRTKDVESADRAYEEAIDTDPNNASVLNNYAYSLAERGVQLDLALDLARRAVELSPDVASFLDTLGWVHFKRGNYDAALERIRSATEAGSATAAVYEHLGDVYKQLGNPARAVEAWKTALQMNPESPALREKIGRK